MTVKCQICGANIDKKAAYAITIKDNKHKYYCSETEYMQDIQTKNKIKLLKQQISEVINDIFGYTVTNTAWCKELQEILKTATLEDVKDYLSMNKDFLCRALSKNFNNEYGKIRYFSAIIKNNIVDFRKNRITEQVKPIVVENDISEGNNYHRKTRRKGFCELQEEE